MLMALIMLVTSVSAFTLTANAYVEPKSASVDGVWFYYTVKDGKATILYSADYNEPYKGKTFTFPSKIKGKKLVAIESFFLYSKTCKTMVIPDSVERLGSLKNGDFYAAISSDTVETIKIGKGLKTIKYNPFITGKKFIVSKDNKNFASEKGVIYNKKKTAIVAFPAGKKPKTYTLNKNVKVVKPFAFTWSVIKNINLNKVQKAYPEAFYGAEFKTVKLGKDAKSISAEAFTWCSYITKIQVNKNNKNFKVKNGVLFNKKGTKLVMFPKGKKKSAYTIPKKVNTVGKDAFAFCYKLGKVSVPSSVTNIQSGAFNTYGLKVNLPKKVKKIGNRAYGSSNITKAAFPKTVTSIGYQAFCGCEKLKSVDMSKIKLKKIKQETFSFTSISSIKFPKGVEEIGYYAFGGTKLKTVTVPKSVKVIRGFGFESDKLTKITVKGKDTELKAHALGYEYYYDDEVGDEVPRQITIVAPKGSKAEKFAKKYGFTFKALS